MSRYTFLTGVVSVNGRPQAWFLNRPEGKQLKLFEGQEFHVGAFSGKILKIHGRDVEIDTERGVICVRNGQNLAEGEPVHHDNASAGL